MAYERGVFATYQPSLDTTRKVAYSTLFQVSPRCHALSVCPGIYGCRTLCPTRTSPFDRRPSHLSKPWAAQHPHEHLSVQHSPLPAYLIFLAMCIQRVPHTSSFQALASSPARMPCSCTLRFCSLSTAPSSSSSLPSLRASYCRCSSWNSVCRQGRGGRCSNHPKKFLGEELMAGVFSAR